MISVILPSSCPGSCVQTNATVSVFAPTPSFVAGRKEKSRGGRAHYWRHFLGLMVVVVLI